MKIELWTPPDAPRPSYILYDDNGEILEVGPLIEDVVCDVCNATVPLRPVPVVKGYALCLDCLDKVLPNWIREVGKAQAQKWLEQHSEFGE